MNSLTMCSGQKVLLQRGRERKKSVWSRISGIILTAGRLAMSPLDCNPQLKKGDSIST